MESAVSIVSDDLDKEGTAQFAGRLMEHLNSGALCLMISIGHRTGLFDVMDSLPPSTEEKIAAASGLNLRYVREWLGAMTTGRIVKYDPLSREYRLPRSHAACLTREARQDNVAVFSQYISVLGNVEDAIVECFKTGNGVPYSSFHRFHEVMAEDSGQSVLYSLLDHILPLVPGLTSRLKAGIRVLDLGCGSGRALLLLADRFRRSRFVGYDLSAEAISQARSEAFRRRIDNVVFESRDLSDFDLTAEPEAFDCVTTFDAIHDQAKPRAVLRGIYRSLLSDGVYLMQDIHASSHVHKNMSHPIAPFLYGISTMHCMTVSLAQGGEGWGAMWGREKAEEELRDAGFSRISVHRLAHDIQNDYYVVMK